MSSAHAIAPITAGVVTRRWLLPNAEHSVSIRHSTYTGFRYVMIDGTEVKGTGGSSQFVLQTRDEGDTMSLQVNSHFVEVTVAPVGRIKFSYRCKCDGKFLTEISMVKRNEPAGFKITIPETQQVVDDKTGKPVIWYRIDITSESDGRGTSCLRRFRQFHDLNGDLLSAFSGSVLAKRMPNFPARKFKLFQDHSSKEFIEGRRQQLQSYMQSLVKVPRVKNNPELLNFIKMRQGPVAKVKVLGNGAVVARPAHLKAAEAAAADSDEISDLPMREGEYEVTFEAGSLGIVLKSRRPDAVNASSFVSKFSKSKKDGSLFQAEKMKTISVGDRISRVAGRDCINRTHADIVRLISSQPRPLKVCFLKGAPARDEAPDEEFEIGELEDSLSGEAIQILGTSATVLEPTRLEYPAGEAAEYKALFEQAGAVDGELSGGAAVEFFKKSELEQTDLKEVWRLAHGGRSTKTLSLKHFFVAMKFISLAQAGLAISYKELAAAISAPHITLVSATFGEAEAAPALPASSPPAAEPPSPAPSAAAASAAESESASASAAAEAAAESASAAAAADPSGPEQKTEEPGDETDDESLDDDLL